MTNIFGQDIALDGDMQARVAANGELVLTDGTDTGVQDIVLRLDTYLASLFYDKGFGSLLRDWVYAENTEEARIGFAAEVKRRLNEDPRVQPGTVSSSVTHWDEKSIQAEASFAFIGTDHEQNLVITVDKSKKEMVIKDANPAVI
ncbi:baseplate assembly protein [Pseudodesulfovibrio sp.]|uniref:baseplate assembly protein n=1 Tax=unclassified Pseudodesulfovibrio TaxID=2661612 RepID=UPI003B00F37A